jgi:hypothetical protein
MMAKTDFHGKMHLAGVWVGGKVMTALQPSSLTVRFWMGTTRLFPI